MLFIFRTLLLMGIFLFGVHANTCDESFEGVINSTGGKVTLTWGSTIHNSSKIITKEWEYNPSGVKCDGGSLYNKVTLIVPHLPNFGCGFRQMV